MQEVCPMRKNVIFKFFVLFALFFTVVMPLSAQKKKFRTLAEIKKSKVIRIALFDDTKPFCYLDENGEYQGYDVYFARRLAADLGCTPEFVAVDPVARIYALNNGKVDLVLANFTVTADRAKKVDFALPYMKVALGIVSPKSALIKDSSELNGKTLIVEKSTIADAYFTKNCPYVKIVRYDQTADAYAALVKGKGQGFSTDNVELIAWAMDHPEFEVGVDCIGSIDAIAPAVQKGNQTLLDWLNKEIESLGKEKFFHADYEATLRPVYGADFDPDTIVVEGGKL